MYTHSSIVSPAQAQYVWWERRVLGHSEGVGKATGDPQLRRDPTKAGKGHIFWGWTLTFMDDTSTSIVKGKYHPYNFLIKWPNCSNFNFPMLCIEASEEPKFELGDKFKNLEASSARQLAEKDKKASLGTNTESKFGQVGSLNLQFVSYIYMWDTLRCPWWFLKAKFDPSTLMFLIVSLYQVSLLDQRQVQEVHG